MLHLASTTPGGTSKPLYAEPLPPSWIQVATGDENTPNHKVVYVHVPSGRKSYKRPTSSLSALQTIDANSPRSASASSASASRKKSARDGSKIKQRGKMMAFISPPLEHKSAAGIAVPTGRNTPSSIVSSPAPSSTMSTPPHLDLSMVFSSTEPTTPHRSSDKSSPSSEKSRSKVKLSASSTSLMSTARVVQRIQAENRMLLQRDSERLKTIAALKEQIRLMKENNRNDSASSDNKTKPYVEVEDELQSTIRNMDEVRDRCKQLEIELASRQQLVEEMMVKHKRDIAQSQDQIAATQKQLDFVIQSCELKELDYTAKLSEVRKEYQMSIVDRKKLEEKCASLEAENEEIELRRATTAEKLATVFAAQKRRKDIGASGDHTLSEEEKKERRTCIAAAVQSAREQWQQHGVMASKKERMRAEERLKRAVSRVRSEAEIAMSKVKLDTDKALERQRVKYTASLDKVKAEMQRDAQNKLTKAKAIAEKELEDQRKIASTSVSKALKGVQKRFQEELQKKQSLYDEELGRIEVNYRMERHRASQLSAFRLFSIYFQRKKVQMKALALARWKGIISRTRLSDVLLATVEYTRRTGAAYCMWAIMQRCAFKKIVAAFRHWEVLAFENYEDGSYGAFINADATRPLDRLQPWTFEATLQKKPAQEISSARDAHVY